MHSESSSPAAVFAATSFAATASLEIPGVTVSMVTSLVLAICVMDLTDASIKVVFPDPTAPTMAMEMGMASLVSISELQ